MAFNFVQTFKTFTTTSSFHFFEINTILPRLSLNVDKYYTNGISRFISSDHHGYKKKPLAASIYHFTVEMSKYFHRYSDITSLDINNEIISSQCRICIFHLCTTYTTIHYYHQHCSIILADYVKIFCVTIT